jgi:type IV secretory pathway TraG/TraD family ATPase VirD4
MCSLTPIINSFLSFQIKNATLFTPARTNCFIRLSTTQLWRTEKIQTPASLGKSTDRWLLPKWLASTFLKMVLLCYNFTSIFRLPFF